MLFSMFLIILKQIRQQKGHVEANKKNSLGCKEIKDISKCFSFSRHNLKPFSLLSKYSPWAISRPMIASHCCYWPRLLCQDPGSSVTLPTQPMYLGVSLETQLSMVTTELFSSSPCYLILFQFLSRRSSTPFTQQHEPETLSSSFTTLHLIHHNPLFFFF